MAVVELLGDHYYDDRNYLSDDIIVGYRVRVNLDLSLTRSSISFMHIIIVIKA